MEDILGDAPAIEEPVIEEPVIEEPALGNIEIPGMEDILGDAPAIEEPVIEEPVIEEPVIEEPDTADNPGDLGIDLSELDALNAELETQENLPDEEDIEKMLNAAKEDSGVAEGGIDIPGLDDLSLGDLIDTTNDGESSEIGDLLDKNERNELIEGELNEKPAVDGANPAAVFSEDSGEEISELLADPKEQKKAEKKRLKEEKAAAKKRQKRKRLQQEPPRKRVRTRARMLKYQVLIK